MQFSQSILAATLTTALAFSVQAGNDSKADAQADDTLKSTTSEFTGEARDAWIDGKLEATYIINRGLSAFDVDTRVTDGRVLLTGAVESEAQKQLAEEIAKSVEGVTEVDNQLVVSEDARSKRDAGPTFADRVEDATLEATLKSKFLLNTEIAGLKIDVDVTNREAVLSGSVSNRTESELAEQIAKNMEGIQSVDNRLQIQS